MENEANHLFLNKKKYKRKWFNDHLNILEYPFSD